MRWWPGPTPTTLALALVAATPASGFAFEARSLPRARRASTAVSGIAGFGTFFAESWLGKDATKVVACPPNKGTFDHVLIDVNQFVHTSTRRATSEDDAVRRLFTALDGILRVARPTRSLVLALDGAAPIAKIVTQRRRREAAVAKSARTAPPGRPSDGGGGEGLASSPPKGGRRGRPRAGGSVSPLLITPGTGSGNKGDVVLTLLSREALPGDLSLESARGVQNSQESLPTHIEWDKKAHLSSRVLSKRVDPFLVTHVVAPNLAR